MSTYLLPIVWAIFSINNCSIKLTLKNLLLPHTVDSDQLIDVQNIAYHDVTYNLLRLGTIQFDNQVFQHFSLHILNMPIMVFT